MKNNYVQSFLKKIVVGLCAVAMVASAMTFVPMEVSQVKASNDTTYWQYETYTDRSNFISSDGRIAPKPKENEYKDYIFAGWFSDSACTIPDTTSDTTGTFYAKFVPAEVLSVGFQISNNVTGNVNTEKSNIRFVSTVDSLEYSKVGFRIFANNRWRDFNSSKVKTKVVSTDENLNVADTYTPNVYHSASQYFVTYRINNIPYTAFEEDFYATPYWETLDGTHVEGITRSVRVEDSYKKIVNVPVRLYNDAQVAAGQIEVKYDTSNFKYVGCTTGLVFEEMESAHSNGVVKIVGNVETITKNVNANGMYANLRFEVSDISNLPQDVTFEIMDSQFCDIEEEWQTVTVIEAMYNDFSPKNNN